MRERELKLRFYRSYMGRDLSLPMRERELKHGKDRENPCRGGRSPCGSAN